MKNIAIITARGGSKRIPRKNIKEFMGKPMLAYAIEAAQKAEIFDEIMVSTDDAEIAEVALKYGAKVPFMRSEATANDFATTADVLNEVIEEYKKKGIVFDNLCCIYPCVPFLKSETLKNAYDKFRNFDALIPVCKYPVPIEWAMKLDGDLLVPNDRDAQNMRSQDIVPKYYDVGMFYFYKLETVYKSHSFAFDNMTYSLIDELECQDIDTFDDWKMAEMKYKVLKGL